MPRVHTKTKNKGGKLEYRCRGCGQPIVAGESYYQWEKRTGGPQRRHTKCGYPRPSELSNRKTAVVEDAIQDAENEIASWSPEVGEDDDEINYDDLTQILESVADTAEEVGNEYEESADNMPESLQQGSQAEMLREVADELREWAENLRDFSPETSIDFDESPDAPEDARQVAIEDAIQNMQSEASDKLQDLPEYQG